MTSNTSVSLAEAAATHTSPNIGACGPSGPYWRNWPQTVVGGRKKRAFDIVVSGVAIVILSPILLLIALLVRARDNGPAIYRQQRVGLGGRPFWCLKFRSMSLDADARLAAHLASSPAAAREWRLNRKLRNDPRITVIGKVLRKTSLDELPQLFNIFRGEMSLIGPRPVVTAELEQYGLARVHYLRTRPGLTGLWQVSGRSYTSYRQRVELDRSYVNKWSFLRDLAILLRTIPALVFRSGAL